MYGEERHHLINEFPEFQHTIDHLKSNNENFSRLLGEYDVTDKKIYGYIQQMQPVADAHLEELKKKRLYLKDQLYSILRQHHGSSVQTAQ